MTVGRMYPPEWRDHLDPLTGRSVRQLTNSPAEDYHLYFYNPSITPDGNYLIFISERTGISNLFRLDLETGTIMQLTDAQPVRAEYWPFTAAVQGVGACLPAIGNGGQEVFYFEGTDLFAVEIEGLKRRQLLSLPSDRRPSMLQSGGETLVFATWDEKLFMERSQRAYAGEKFPDEQFFQETTSTILRVEAATGQAEEVFCKDKFWINHVHVNPRDRDLILFCHEYSGLPDRMWLLNVADRRCAPIPGQGAGEWYEHEFWSGDGQRVCFHGGSAGDNTQGFCGWCSSDGTNYTKAYHSTSGRAYAHYNLHPDPYGQTMVTDGEARPGCISKVHLREGRQVFEVLCRHDSYTFGDDQRCHPHPSFTPDGRQVIFTSNRTGSSNVYLTDWDEKL